MATARQFEIESGDLGAGAYDALECPGDYEAVLVGVDDYDKRETGGSFGWVWEFTVEGLPFREWTSFSPGARWKLVELVSAFGYPVEEGLLEVNPNAFVGQTIGVTIDWDPVDSKWDGTSPRYRRISRMFELVDLDDFEVTLSG